MTSNIELAALYLQTVESAKSKLSLTDFLWHHENALDHVVNAHDPNGDFNPEATKFAIHFCQRATSG